MGLMSGRFAICFRCNNHPHRRFCGEAVHVEQGAAAGGLNLRDIPVRVCGFQRGHGQRQIFQTDKVHHQRAMRFQAGEQ